MRDNPSEVQEESMVVSSLITGHINGPVTWREVAMLAIVVAVLYYCKRRYKY
ncbi:MAG TPA: hypothetical protein VFF64_26380 [Candidatus Eremiobacteraceae bacterium]|nr:hypothetical protein [Candidatus Eremiobacteraceae bacterium]